MLGKLVCNAWKLIGKISIFTVVWGTINSAINKIIFIVIVPAVRGTSHSFNIYRAKKNMKEKIWTNTGKINKNKN